MQMSSSFSRIFCGAVAAALLGGCGGGAAAPPASPLVSTSARAQSDSWFAPEAKSMDLLYVADLNNNAVYAFSYPGGKLEGTISGMAVPHGVCTDAKGNVYATNGGMSQILEFAHGGTTPLKTLDASGYFPQDCAIDPTTGNLAVTASPLGSGPGAILVYKKGKGTAKAYTTPNVFRVYFDGYDAAGNLFVDGTDMHGAFEFAEMPHGGTAFSQVAVNAQVNLPGAIQWDGTNLAVGDQVSISGPSKVDAFQVSGGTATLVGTTNMTDSCDMLGFFINGKRIIAANDCTPNVMYFKYPAGGASTKTIGDSLSEPVSVTVSPAS